MTLTVEQKEVIQKYRKAHKNAAKLSDAQIIAILNEHLNEVKLNQNDSTSLFWSNKGDAVVDSLDLKSSITINEKNGKYAVNKGGEVKYYTLSGSEIGKDDYEEKDYCELVSVLKEEIKQYREEHKNAVYFTDVQIAALIQNSANAYIMCGITAIENYYAPEVHVLPDGKFMIEHGIKKYYDNQGRQISEEEYKPDYTNITPHHRQMIKTFRKENPHAGFLSDIQVLQSIFYGIKNITVYNSFNRDLKQKEIKLNNKTFTLYNEDDYYGQMYIYKHGCYDLGEKYCFKCFNKSGKEISGNGAYFPGINNLLSYYRAQINRFRAKHKDSKYLTDAQIALILYYDAGYINIYKLGKDNINIKMEDYYTYVLINENGDMQIGGDDGEEGTYFNSKGELIKKADFDNFDFKKAVNTYRQNLAEYRKKHKESDKLNDAQLAIYLYYNPKYLYISSNNAYQTIEQKEDDYYNITCRNVQSITVNDDGNICVIGYSDDDTEDKYHFYDKNGNIISPKEYYDISKLKNPTDNHKNYIAAFRKKHSWAKDMTDLQILVTEKLNLSQVNIEHKDDSSNNYELGEDNTSVIKIRPSGRFFVKTETADIFYFEKDGTPIEEDKFKHLEYDIFYKGKDNKEENFADIIKQRYDGFDNKINKAKSENGIIGKTWDYIKSFFGGDSDELYDKKREDNFTIYWNNQNIDGKRNNKADFKRITGVDLTNENLEKYKQGEIKSRTEHAIDEYRKGQDTAVDVVGDIVSGAAAFGAYALTVAAPFSAAIPPVALGFAAAAVIGGLVKVGVKSLETATSSKKFSLKQTAKDFVTGAFSGILAPFTGGLGGAVGKRVAAKLGIQAVKHVGSGVAKTGMEVFAEQGIKNVVNNGAKRTFKQKFTTAMTNPAGYQYFGGSSTKRKVAFFSELATGGALAGGIDGSFREAVDGGSLEDIKDAGISGTICGAAASPILGGIFKKIGRIFHNKGAKKVDPKGLEKYSDEKFKLWADDVMRDYENSAYKDYSATINYIKNNENLKYNREFMSGFDSMMSTAKFKKIEPDFVKQMVVNSEELGISSKDLRKIFNAYEMERISYKQVKKVYRVLGRTKVSSLKEDEFRFACKFIDFQGKTNINELSAQSKKTLLRNLVGSNSGTFEMSDEFKKMFPIIPSTQEEYCSLLPAIARSLGIETNPITKEAAKHFNTAVGNLGKTLAAISDEEFAKLQISQTFGKDDFINIARQKLGHLSSKEQQKVFDYFGFELHYNKSNPNKYSLTGYPVNLNNGKKLAQIESEETKAVIEALRADVIRFSEQNRIKCNNPEVEKMLNEIVDVLPELRSMIGRKQHKTHDFDVMQHSLKVMQKVSQEPQFKQLNESDKKIMTLATLLHDITKAEGLSDRTHAAESAFDAFYIAKKFNLTRDEEIKLYTLIKQHEWLKFANSAPNEKVLTERLQEIAFRLQNDNLFEMALMFTHADLKAVKANNVFHDAATGKGRAIFNSKNERIFGEGKGSVKSFGETADIYAEKIRGYVKELQPTKPLLPITKLPTASTIRKAITIVNSDGTTNIKGVYISKEKNGKELVVIKYNEVEDWEAIGFPKGTISRGITNSGSPLNSLALFNTGNIKFFVHGLSWENQLAKFDAFALPDSEVLLSVSYAERVESKFRFFRKQGVILDVPSKYVYGGGKTDSGSGCGKFVSDFIENYVFGGIRESDRKYVSKLIKKATGMNDEEYLKFLKENEDKSMVEIQPANIRNRIIQAFATINSNVREGLRAYNEMYVSNPRVMGVFAYNAETESYGAKAGKIKNIMKFISEQKDFLKTYATEHDIPFIVFGD